MLIGLFSFFVIFGAVCLALRISFHESVSKNLSEISTNYQENNEILRKDCLIISAKSKGDFTIVNGEDYFSYPDTIEIIDGGLNFNSGKLNSICYKAFSHANGKLIVAIDCEALISALNTIQNRTLIILLIVYAVYSLIICAFSVKVFRPMQESLFRQKEFLSNAGHELKTPLTIISASADVLMADGENKYVENIKAQTKRLEFLVNDMLTLAQIDEEKFKVNKQNVNVSNLILECALPFEEKAFIEGKTFLIEIAENIYKNVDAKSLKTIINVLLDNAFKYSNDKGTIKLSLKQIGNKAVFVAYNTGSLIPSELSDKIFERFFRGENSRSREHGGNGLGLSIAKNLCALNGFKIKAKSVYNQDMTITLEII